MHTHVYGISICTHTHIYIYMHIVYMYMCVYMYIHMCIYIIIQCAFTYLFSCCALRVPFPRTNSFVRKVSVLCHGLMYIVCTHTHIHEHTIPWHCPRPITPHSSSGLTTKVCTIGVLRSDFDNISRYPRPPGRLCTRICEPGQCLGMQIGPEPGQGRRAEYVQYGRMS